MSDDADPNGPELRALRRHVGELRSQLGTLSAALAEAQQREQQAEAQARVYGERCGHLEEQVRQLTRSQTATRAQSNDMQVSLSALQAGQYAEGRGGALAEADRGVSRIEAGSESETSADAVAAAAIGAAGAALHGVQRAAAAEESVEGAHGRHVEREVAKELRQAVNVVLARSLKCWTVSGWVGSLGVCGVVAEALIARLRRASNGQIDYLNDGGAEREFIRQLGKRGTYRLVIDILRESALVEKLATLIWEGVEQLKDETRAGEAAQPRGPAGGALPAKLLAEGLTTKEVLGRSVFVKGLDQVLPLPKLGSGGVAEADLAEAVRREHCEGPDAKTRFESDDYGTTSTSEIEWWFVAEPRDGLRKLGLPAWPVDTRLREDPTRNTERRAPARLVDFSAKLKEVNKRLRALGCLPMRSVELVAARLLTGPMRSKYRAVLCGLTTESPQMRMAFEEQCRGNTYPVTIHLIASAIHKLSKLTAPSTVYRGVPGNVVPWSLWRTDRGGAAGGVAAAFLSATADCSRVAAAAREGASGLQCAMIDLEMGVGDTGAELSWLSQYPHEREVAFPPLTGLTVIGSRIGDAPRDPAEPLSVDPADYQHGAKRHGRVRGPGHDPQSSGGEGGAALHLRLQPSVAAPSGLYVAEAGAQAVREHTQAEVTAALKAKVAQGRGARPAAGAHAEGRHAYAAGGDAAPADPHQTYWEAEEQKQRDREFAREQATRDALASEMPYPPRGGFEFIDVRTNQRVAGGGALTVTDAVGAKSTGEGMSALALPVAQMADGVGIVSWSAPGFGSEEVKVLKLGNQMRHGTERVFVCPAPAPSTITAVLTWDGFDSTLELGVHILGSDGLHASPAHPVAKRDGKAAMRLTGDRAATRTYQVLSGEMRVGAGYVLAVEDISRAKFEHAHPHALERAASEAAGGKKAGLLSRLKDEVMGERPHEYITADMATSGARLKIFVHGHPSADLRIPPHEGYGWWECATVWLRPPAERSPAEAAEGASGSAADDPAEEPQPTVELRLRNELVEQKPAAPTDAPADASLPPSARGHHSPSPLTKAHSTVAAARRAVGSFIKHEKREAHDASSRRASTSAGPEVASGGVREAAELEAALRRVAELEAIIARTAAPVAATAPTDAAARSEGQSAPSAPPERSPERSPPPSSRASRAALGAVAAAKAAAAKAARPKSAPKAVPKSEASADAEQLTPRTAALEAQEAAWDAREAKAKPKAKREPRSPSTPSRPPPVGVVVPPKAPSMADVKDSDDEDAEDVPRLPSERSESPYSGD